MFLKRLVGLGLALSLATPALGAPSPKAAPLSASPDAKELRARLKELTQKNPKKESDLLVFDLPVTYNKKVSKWINYFQTRGQTWFREWLERSTRYMPFIQKELKEAGLPTDLAYMVMIESGFSFQATSIASAVGPWQFIEPTGVRYGLTRSWWLDERRDLMKSTRAAIRYLKDLHKEFGSWYLVAASYNMGENGLRGRIKKYKTKDYWQLVRAGALPAETQEYVPKILAAMLISKAPNMYGFRDLERRDSYEYEIISVPGGTDLNDLADHIGVTRKALKDLNAELVLGYIPRQVEKHMIRLPRGAGTVVASYVQNQRDK
ncbi:MAG: transglycosylase SLT domain-containing protein [Bdellovibrionaceae bacterium]|nr:transglycosylase SLT domain-containing protein [Pseudobdellovibrionaceae bacterium]